MPDVGILNLQIQDNSQKAADGLTRLVGLLRQMKEATTGNKLASVASGIEKINRAVQQIGSGDGLNQLSRLAGILERIQTTTEGIGGITINFGRAGQSARQIQEGLAAARAETARTTSEVGRTEDALVEVGKTAQETTEVIKGISSGVSEIGTAAKGIGEVREAVAETAQEMSGTNSISGIADGAEETKTVLEAVSSSAQEVAASEKAMIQGTAESSQVLEEENRLRAEQIRLRQEEMRAANEQRLANNYPQYRELFLSGEGNWQQAVPDMYGLTPKAIEESETYADALKATIRECNEYVDEFINKTNSTGGTLFRDVIDSALGITNVTKSARQSASAFEELLSKREEMEAIVASGHQLSDSFSGLDNARERVELLVEKLGFLHKALQEEMESDDPSERRINSLSLRINGIIRSIGELNSKASQIDMGTAMSMDNIGEAGKLDLLIMKRNALTRALMEGMEAEKLSESQIISRALQIQNLTEKIEKLTGAEQQEVVVKHSLEDTNNMAGQINQYDLLAAKLREAQEAYNALMNDPSANASKQMGGAMAIHKAEADINAYNALQEKLQTVDEETRRLAQDQLNAGVSAATLTKQLFGLDGELKRKKGDLSAVSNETKSLTQRFSELVGGASGLGGAIKKMFPTLTGMLSRFKQLAKYRMLRAVITQITKGFKEGLENYYRYSEAVGGSFAPAMDSAASSLAQMKNSIGAAVAPALQALIPVLNSVVNWVISGVNWLNQFFALLNGQKTWSKAMPQTTKAFDDQSKKAKKAGAAIKDLLADWDELNIIQSNTSGGGGTGGTTPATDYIKMFEEVKTFDKSVGDFIDRIKNTFGDIKELVALVGTAILGWKFSRAFNNVLGKIGQLAAGISISIIGVKLAYGGAYSAGQKGFFDTTDLVQTIGGIFAAGIGGELVGTAVFGPGVGFAVGITVGIVAALVGYIEGMKDTEDALKWGSNSLTPEQIQDYVKKQFTFDIDARINLLDAMIVGQEDAQRALNEKVTAFNESLSKVTISVDDGPQGIEKAADDAMALIDQINSNIAQSEKNIEVLAKIVPLTNQDGEDETDSILAGLKIADKGLTEYFTDMGKEIAHWIDLGQKNEWKNNEAEMAMELMRHQQNIIDQANKSKSKREFEVATEVSLSTMTRDSAKAVYDEEIKRIEEYKQKILEATQNEMVNALWYADLADAAGLKDESGNPLGDYYRTYAESLKKQIEDGTIYNELNDSVKKQKEAWIKALQKIYGNDKDTGLALTLFTRGLFTPDKLQQTENTLLKEFGDYSSSNILNSDFYTTLMAKWASVDGNATEDIANYISGILSSGFGKVDPQNIIGSTAKAWGFSLINILNDDMRTEMVRALYMSSGQDTEATENVLRLLGLDDETIKRTVSAVKAQQSDEVDKIKEAYENGEELKDDMEDETDRVSEGMPTVGLPVGVHPEAYIEPGEENIDIDTGSGTGAGIGLPIDLQFDSDKSWIGNIAEQLGFELVNGQYVLKAYIKYITDDQAGNTPNLDEETRSPIPGGAQLWTMDKSGVTPGATWAPGGEQGGTMNVVAEVDNSEQESNVANGVTRGMTGVEGLLESIAQTVVGILNKPVPTAGYPTANEGRRNAQAGREYGMVTGEYS